MHVGMLVPNAQVYLLARIYYTIKHRVKRIEYRERNGGV